MWKIGFVGNSCTGKTTAAFSLIAKLKLARALVGYCTDTARSITFDPSRLDDAPLARAHVLFRQLTNETEQMVRKDVDYLVTERTALDWYLYYVWTCQNVGAPGNERLRALVDSWTRTYDLLVYLDSKEMTYVHDGFRPASTRIRDEIEPLYVSALSELRNSRSPDSLIVIDGHDLGQRNAAAMAALDDWLRLQGGVFVRDTRKP